MKDNLSGPEADKNLKENFWKASLGQTSGKGAASGPVDVPGLGKVSGESLPKGVGNIYGGFDAPGLTNATDQQAAEQAADLAHTRTSDQPGSSDVHVIGTSESEDGNHKEFIFNDNSKTEFNRDPKTGTATLTDYNSDGTKKEETIRRADGSETTLRYGKDWVSAEHRTTPKATPHEQPKATPHVEPGPKASGASAPVSEARTEKPDEKKTNPNPDVPEKDR